MKTGKNLHDSLSAFLTKITRIRPDARTVALVLSLIVFPISGTMAATYYVDSVAGLDTNNGTSTSTPWKTLTKVNGITFLPGDSVLFKRGSSWTGTLVPLGTGNATAPLVFDAYGTGTALPLIIGTGADAVALWDKHNFTFQNFEITNDGTSDAVRNGIHLYYNVTANFPAVSILNNDIHNVRGLSARGGMYGNAALFVELLDTSGTSSVMPKMDGLLIQGNDIHDIKTIGIYHKSPNLYQTHPELWATNLVIRDNVITNTGCDHIIVAGANGATIEYNAGYDAGINGVDYQYIAGMWSSYWSKNSVFQCNEVARMHNELAPNGGDSQAFDCDLGTSGTNIFQYNYTHDNSGGVLIMMYENVPKTVIYRYNLSVNDDCQTNSGSQFPINPIAGVNSAYIYNNVFYTTLPLGFNVMDRDASYFYNNIFYAPTGMYACVHTIYSNNCFFGHIPSVNDPCMLLADPKFAGPLPTTAGGDGDIPANTDGFKLQASSPCINWGMNITAPISNGGIDFWGNPLYSGTFADVGIQEVVGGSNPPPAVTFVDDTPGSSVVYTGTGWGHASGDATFYNTTKSYSPNVGDYVQYTFNGTNVSLFGRRGPGYGKLNISIDGGAAVSVDNYWGYDMYRTELFQTAGLTSGTHTIKATVVTKNPASTSNMITLDNFQVWAGTPAKHPFATTVDDPSSASVVYSGSWSSTTGGSSYYAGTRTASANIGDRVDFTFTGDGVRILGTKAPICGKLSVTIDGGPAMVVDCFQPGPTYYFMAKFYEIDGLTYGTHTMSATIAAKNPLSTGNTVSIDCFQTLVGSVAPAEVIMDNTAATGITITGTWPASTSISGYYGSNYLSDNNELKGSKSVRFTPVLQAAGSYDVYAWWTAYSNRATNVPIDIISTSGTSTVQVNQQTNGGQWVFLGTYSFNAGAAGSVLIRNTATNGYVIADAVRFRPH